MVLKDNELDTLEPVPEAIAVFVLVDAGADPASEPNKGLWWDIEDECYVDDDLCSILLLEYKGLVSTLAQAQPYSHYHPPRSLQEQSN